MAPNAARTRGLPQGREFDSSTLRHVEGCGLRNPPSSALGVAQLVERRSGLPLSSPGGEARLSRGNRRVRSSSAAPSIGDRNASRGYPGRNDAHLEALWASEPHAGPLHR